MNEMLGMSEVAELLGLESKSKDPARVVRSFLKEMEIKTGQRIMLRRGGKLYTTETLLRNALPDLFVEDKYTLETMRGLRQLIDIQGKRIEELTAKVTLLSTKLDSLR